MREGEFDAFGEAGAGEIERGGAGVEEFDEFEVVGDDAADVGEFRR